MTIHEDWSTAIDWLNSRETDAEKPNERSGSKRR
jgi:hypothetical protein